MSPRAKTEERQAQIIAAALEILADTSLAGLSTRRIAKALGLSQPALFRHFRNRDEILLAVVAHTRERLGRDVQDTLASASTAHQRLLTLAQAILAHVQAHPGLPRLLFADAAAGDNSPAVRAALGHLLSMQRTLVSELIRDGQREGSVCPSLNPATAATMLIGMLQGLVLQWEIAGRTEPLAPQARAALNLWLRGTAPRPGDPTARAGVGEALGAGLAQGEGQRQRGDQREGAPKAPPELVPTFTLLDVRPILATGRDPLAHILAQVEASGPAGFTCVIAPFAPRPLVTLLSSRGFHVALRPLSEQLWAVEVGGAEAPDVLALEDREPPEPMQRVLEAAAQLGPGQSLLARLPREPRLLFPRLRERGLRWESVSLPEPGGVLVRVTRPEAQTAHDSAPTGARA